MTNTEQHEFTWNSGHLSILIGVTFERKWKVIDHLEVRSLHPEKAKLPITSTGYRSHFAPIGAIEECGGAVAAARMLLDEAARSPEWQEHVSSARQGTLF